MTVSAEMIIAIVVILVLVVGAFWLLLGKKRRRADAFEDMEGHEFEYFCADLLEQNGFIDVEVTRGSGDYGIDILAEKEGVTYAVQCK